MILSRSLLRALAGWLTGLLLFAHFAIAAHACGLAAHAPAPMPAAGANAEHCHTAPAVDPDLLCAAHCNADEQSPFSNPSSVPPMPAVAVLIVPAIAPAQAVAAKAGLVASEIAPATDPPPAILFHAFRS